MSFRLKKAFIWKNLLLFSGSFIVIYLLLVNNACAEPNTGIVKDITNEFYTKSQQWGDVIKKYALSLFYVLLILDVCVFGVRMVLQRPELPMILGQFAMMLITAGIFFAIVNNWQEWSWQVINGMIGISDELGIQRTDADAPFKAASELVIDYWENASAFSPIYTLGLAIATVVIVICLALITAQVLFIKCEAMVALAAAMVLLGFGGSGMFKDYAVNTCRYALAVAFKLFVIYLLLGIGMSFINDFTVSSESTDTLIRLQEILTTLAACAVLLVLVKQLPDACAGIINGSHVSNSNALGSAVMAGVHVGAAAATGGASAVAAGAAGLSNVKAAASLAGMQGQGGIMGTARTLGSAMSRARESGQSVSSVLRSQHEAQRQNDSL